MAKFNETKPKNTTKNHMGGVAFKQSAKSELAHAVLTSFIEDSYYEKATDRLGRIKELVAKIAPKDPVFVAKLAIFTRDQMNMRSGFHVLVGELAKHHKGDSLVSDLMNVGTKRVDDLVEIVSYVGKPVPNQVKKGIAKALSKFDEYQLAKYKAEGKAWSLRDVVRIAHPKATTAEQNETFKKLIAGELKQTGKTHEARLSSGEKKEVVFKDMLKNKKLGYMATLRNLRNIEQTGDKETIDMAIKFITNKKAIENSRQLPFRFLSAYEALQGAGASKKRTISFEMDSDATTLMQAVDKAITLSCQNIPELSGQTMILSDNSGSMGGDHGGGSLTSAHSQRTTANIANLFATMYWMRANNTYVGLFGDRLIQPKLDRNKTLIENYQIIGKEAGRCGGSTETGIFEAFETMIREKTKPARIFIFSDCQVGTGCRWYDTGRRRAADFNNIFQEFHKMSPDTMIYTIDLKGYGNMMFAPGSKIVQLAGWSDKIFDMAVTAEKSVDAVVKEIESVQL